MACWPWRVNPDECRQDLTDSEPVHRGVLRQALQRVDAADADVNLVVAKLIDRVGGK